MGKEDFPAFWIVFLFAATHVHAAPFRVVIDPGHGGGDQGTISQKDGVKLTEKEVTLQLSLETARQLRNRGYQVWLTRTGDQDLTLNARTALANKNKADIFISIHMNSPASAAMSDAEGIETYILNNATDATSKRLAHFENTGLSAGAGSKLAQASEQTEVALILKDLTLDANLAESKRLACAIQNSLVSVTSQGLQSQTGPGNLHRNRGVKQALFYVLLGADMPSVLVEAGFLSSARDRTLVTSPHGQRAVGASILRAIEQFRRTRGTPAALSELSRCKVH